MSTYSCPECGAKYEHAREDWGSRDLCRACCIERMQEIQTAINDGRAQAVNAMGHLPMINFWSGLDLHFFDAREIAAASVEALPNSTMLSIMFKSGEYVRIGGTISEIYAAQILIGEATKRCAGAAAIEAAGVEAAGEGYDLAAKLTKTAQFLVSVKRMDEENVHERLCAMVEHIGGSVEVLS